MMAYVAFRSVFPMVVRYAIDAAFGINSERYAVQTAIAGSAAETSRMIRLSKGLQNLLRDEMAASRTLLSRLLETRILHKRYKE